MNKLEKEVRMIIENHGGAIFAQDVLSHGCASGCVPELIYYSDTHKFFDTHYEDIEQLRREFEEETGLPMNIDSDLKNFLAWWAFEYMTFKIFG